MNERLDGSVFDEIGCISWRIWGGGYVEL